MAQAMARILTDEALRRMVIRQGQHRVTEKFNNMTLINDLAAALHPWGLWLVVGGGLSYTVGAVFYAWKRLPYNHVLWHIFVLGGSAAHFFCIFNFVLGVGGQ